MIMKLIKLFSILISLVFIISCDLFFPAPVGRDNPEDDEVQIRNFSSLITGSDTITTVWDWRSPNPATSDSRIIEEIWIVHSENDMPLSRFPLNPDEVKKIKVTANWYVEWTNLKNDSEHYFALYARERGGTWLAPKYTDQFMDNNPGYVESSTGVPVLIRGNITTGGVLLNGDTTVNETIWGVARIDYSPISNIEYNINVELNISGGTVGDFLIVPGYYIFESGDSWDLISDPDNLDYDNKIEVNISGYPVNINITNIFNITAIYGSNTFVLIPTTAGSSGVAATFDTVNMMPNNYSYWRRN